MSQTINQSLCELIRKAQGERSQNQFAQQCGISSAAITRISLGTYSPSAKTLKKIASHAYNGVTYESLMNAAGFLTAEQRESQIELSDEDKTLGAQEVPLFPLSEEEQDLLELRSEIIRTKGEDFWKSLEVMLQAIAKEKK